VPLITATERARTSIDLTIFRFDLRELEEALAAAVARGVIVRALVAHTNTNGEGKLRKLEKKWRGDDLLVEECPLKRLHVRAIMVERGQAPGIPFC